MIFLTGDIFILVIFLGLKFQKDDIGDILTGDILPGDILTQVIFYPLSKLLCYDHHNKI